MFKSEGDWKHSLKIFAEKCKSENIKWYIFGSASEAIIGVDIKPDRREPCPRVLRNSPKRYHFLRKFSGVESRFRVWRGRLRCSGTEIADTMGVIGSCDIEGNEQKNAACFSYPLKKNCNTAKTPKIIATTILAIKRQKWRFSLYRFCSAFSLNSFRSGWQAINSR